MNIFTVTDSHNFHNQFVIDDLGNNTIITNPNAITMF